MAQTNINIRMDEGLKQEFDWLCTELGLNMTTAFNVFARAVVQYRRIPFDIALDPNAETIAAIKEVQHMKENPSLYKGYTDIDQMMKELLS
jgi:DNA-damage-inducible protein J